MRKRLLQLYDEIDARANATIAEHPFWPCKRGCDACCRRLAEEPRMTREEWAMLSEGIALLGDEVRATIDERIAALRDRSEKLITCPLLDRENGACLVYAHRPSACRTYGFYVRRQDGMHCTIVEDAVRANESDSAPVVWGNQESIDHALAVSFDAELPLTSLWRGPDSPSPSSSI